MVTYDGGTTGKDKGLHNEYFSRFKIFIDGISQHGNTVNIQTNNGISDSLRGQVFTVGQYGNNYHMGNECKLDEFAIWDSDQTNNVAKIYNGGLSQNLSALKDTPVHWWRMGDGDTFPDILDNIGNAHLTMINMTAANIATDSP